MQQPPLRLLIHPQRKRLLSQLDEATALFTRTAGAALLQLPEGDLLWVVNVHLHPNQPRIREQEGQELVRRMQQLQAETPHIIFMGGEHDRLQTQLIPRQAGTQPARGPTVPNSALRSILAGLRAHTDIAVFADTNSEVDEAVHRVLRASEALGLCNSMEAVGGGLQGTSRPIGPDAGDAIDHIYVSRSLRSTLRRAEVVTRPGFHAADVDAVRRGKEWVHSDHLPVSCELELGGAAARL